MNSRERVKASINFEKPDRIACGDNLWEDTVALWHAQGMPLEFGHFSLDSEIRIG